MLLWGICTSPRRDVSSYVTSCAFVFVRACARARVLVCTGKIASGKSAMIVRHYYALQPCLTDFFVFYVCMYVCSIYMCVCV